MEIVDNERRTSAYPDFNRFDDASDYVGFIKIMKGVFSKSVNDFIIVLTESVNGGCAMNERFFSLSAEKQQAIINAGYRVFSQNSYKTSPMSEISDAAGISKSLLFHYFHNKKELYMFLWDKCAEITIEYLTKYNCYEQKNLFESMERGMRAKMEIIRLYPEVLKVSDTDGMFYRYWNVVAVLALK